MGLRNLAWVHLACAFLVAVALQANAAVNGVEAWDPFAGQDAGPRVLGEHWDNEIDALEQTRAIVQQELANLVQSVQARLQPVPTPEERTVASVFLFQIRELTARIAHTNQLRLNLVTN